MSRNPSAAQIAQILTESQLVDLTGGQSTAQEASIVVDDRNRNITRQRASGVDFLGKYAQNITVGSLDYSLNIAYLSLRQQVTSQAPMMSLSGMVFYPPRWRGRLGVTWQASSFQGSLYANYTGSLSEPDSLPPEAVAPWWTFDGQVGYTLHTYGYWGTSRVALSAENLLDRRPPHVATTQAGAAAVNYDSTNASPVGRLLVLTFTIFW